MLRTLNWTHALLRQRLSVVFGVTSALALGQTQGEFDKYKKYDVYGNVVESVGLSPNGTVAETYYSEYDSRHRLIRSYKIRAGSSEKEWINLYDYGRKGRLKESLWYATESMVLYQREAYQYDRKGNRILVARYDSEGKLVSVETWKYKDGVVVEHRIEPPPPDPIPCEEPVAR